MRSMSARGRRRAAAQSDRFALPSSATIRTVETLRSELLAALERQAALEIDCAALAEADLSLIQVLLAARKTAQASGKTLALAQPASGVLRDVLLRSGFLAAAGGPPKEQDAFWLKGAAAP
jgi:ABC-type transporter Mla MlaB component